MVRIAEVPFKAETGRGCAVGLTLTGLDDHSVLILSRSVADPIRAGGVQKNKAECFTAQPKVLCFRILRCFI